MSTSSSEGIPMSRRGELLQLPNGGHIAYDEYGDPTGIPVLFCHGWPSSRTMARLTDAAARDLGVRIISPDRPGISDSAFAPERKLVDWPAVVDALMAHLSIREFRVLGISGGAPYAYATGWAMPERVTAVAIASGAPPIAELPNHDGLLPAYRAMLTVYARWPKLCRRLFSAARPFAMVRPSPRLRPMFLSFLQPCDADVLRDAAAFDACFESARRAWRGSAAGVMTDAEVYAQPWGFRLEDVRVPVQLWHGVKDRAFAVRLAEQVAARLPNARLRLVDDAGHYSLPIRHIPEILRDLVAA
jgi:pimeloyl-ACP methyl ester carboxylesterase